MFFKWKNNFNQDLIIIFYRFFFFFVCDKSLRIFVKGKVNKGKREKERIGSRDALEFFILFNLFCGYFYGFDWNKERNIDFYMGDRDIIGGRIVLCSVLETFKIIFQFFFQMYRISLNW